ncbi:hypothetical protein N7462_001681 [Penicillium macrosclerotiorum]|uniref:uncharacterized protein n=1 Tax=Penicillium macrosclerotiorum TaxID=303699 RepID=UPI002548C593|nr:uncharacterized protein N7462_001681 [Penicillium macrosclerotiorum]KAJ5692258.1 hypothetical protein N7462_001681 [Penicillium macrosclerotiorum]
MHFRDRLRAVVSRRRKRASVSFGHGDTIWKRLPDNILVSILAFCDLKGITSLALSCRLLHHRVLKKEFAISKAYLNIRKKADILDTTGESSGVWGDDLTFISQLFPPPPPQYAFGEGHDDAEYSLGYLADLECCWATCLRLSYHLADHEIRHHLDTDMCARSLWSSSKTEKEVVYSKAVISLQAKLLPSVAYAIFFLESSAAESDIPRSECSEQTHEISSSMETQLSILQKPPFTDTTILVSTQHCMQLLCSTVRRLMSPDFPHSSSENWVALLLLTSTLEKVVEFFLAIAKDDDNKHCMSPDSTWSHRKEFLWHMHEDLIKYMESKSQTPGCESSIGPTLNDIWFGASYQEMTERRAVPHSAEDSVPVLHGSVVTLHCKYCWTEE